MGLLFILLLITAAGSYGFTLLLPLHLGIAIPLAILISLILTLLLFVILVVFILLPIFSKTNPNGYFKHLMFRQIGAIVTLFARTPHKVEGLENLLPKSNEPLLIVANHKSNMDGVWLHRILKRPLTAIGKQELAENFFYKKLIDGYKIVTIDRENNRKAAVSISTAIKHVQNGLPMMIFTEGGIKSRETGQMVTVRPGAYKVAYKSEANIQVMAIHNSNLIKERKKFQKIKVTIKILPPIMYEDYKDLNTTELGLKIAKMINETFDEEQVKVEVL